TCSPYELVANCVMNQRRIAGEAELAKDARAVGADRARRKPHLARDLADLLAGGEQPHDAVFTIRELLVQRLLRIARAFRGEDFRERCGNILAAVRHFAHGGGEFLWRAVLGDVTSAACAQY